MIKDFYCVKCGYLMRLGTFHDLGKYRRCFKCKQKHRLVEDRRGKFVLIGIGIKKNEKSKD